MPTPAARWVPTLFLWLLPVLAVPSRVHAQPTRTLIVVAHQDDDLAAAATASERVAAGDPLQTVYLTSGDAGENCADYVLSRERGVRAAYAELAGMPEAPDCSAASQTRCWRLGERFYDARLVRVWELEGSRVSLVFFGFPNPPSQQFLGTQAASLERLWAVPGATLDTSLLDGRRYAERYTKAALLSALVAVLEGFAPTHVMTLDPKRQQPLVYPFEHTDHVHTALFTFAALQRYGQQVELVMERGYSSQFLPKTRTGEQLVVSRTMADAYVPHDPKICAGSVELCGRASECFEPQLFDLPKEHYYTTRVVTGAQRQVVMPGGACLDVLGRGVLGLPCLSFSPSQRWNLLASGQIQHASSGQCLRSVDGRAVGLATCAPEPTQRFSLLDNGALLGPDAGCMSATLAVVGLEACAADLRQTGFFAY